MKLRMSRHSSITAILGLILAIAMGIGIVSNLVVPFNFKMTAVVVIGCIVVWQLKPYYLNWAERLSDKTVNWLLVAMVALIVIIQIAVLWVTPATVYHDPFRTIVQAEQLSRGNLTWNDSIYFQRFPNNVSLTVILAGWLKATSWLHMTTNNSVHLLSLILLDGFIVIMLRALLRLSHRHGAVILAGMFFLVSPFAYTYYLQVFYSDLPTLICLALTFNIVIGWQHFGRLKKWLAAFGLVVVITLGEVVKPNLIVLLVAVLLVTIWLAFRNRIALNQLKTPFILIAVGFALAVPSAHGLSQVSHFQPNNAEAFPTTHWIWMSYNPKYAGRYNFEDVQKLSQIKGKTQKQAYLKKALPARLKSLGPAGILGRWVEKASILLNVSFMQQAYTGGFIQAPGWYQKMGPTLSLLGSLIMRIGFILLYTETLIRCLRLWRNRATIPTVDPRITLTILTALGYLAFHTLLWETESRYGQVMLPILGILCALPSLATANLNDLFVKRSMTAKRVGWSVVGLLAVFVGVGAGNLQRMPQSPVATQQSQLSLQFDAKRTPIEANGTLTQEIRLNHLARSASVSLAPDLLFSGQLVNLKTHRHYRFTRMPSALVINHVLPVGNYQIQLKNLLNRPQSLLLTQTLNDRLAPYPLVYGGTQHPYASFVYQFDR
ncbi:hypothetical protein FD04_GL001045 [Secundilactobacillus odoratitofui DSM 19909 = JCM 15043]|uniref:Glycosyltransferase RgtA/B/C/D-like domain-containing protein n=1 Tax=Secundilactobacillus odoratitofui DSM 19909 = JCM 15043 TaxID=1423776 RepID=A0A0R1LWR5_9LACO|nr:hypothetical protein [Secundilactobacillus odoratitofui]KRK98067.1 hypothetical protein FD04_GL001045 [Secundilactobacillus odoratitofui DSM 19909 = JCM 15043]